MNGIINKQFGVVRILVKETFCFKLLGHWKKILCCHARGFEAANQLKRDMEQKKITLSLILQSSRRDLTAALILLCTDFHFVSSQCRNETTYAHKMVMPDLGAWLHHF